MCCGKGGNNDKGNISIMDTWDTEDLVHFHYTDIGMFKSNP